MIIVGLLEVKTIIKVEKDNKTYLWEPFNKELVKYL